MDYDKLIDTFNDNGEIVRTVYEEDDTLFVEADNTIIPYSNEWYKLCKKLLNVCEELGLHFCWYMKQPKCGTEEFRKIEQYQGTDDEYKYYERIVWKFW